MTQLGGADRRTARTLAVRSTLDVILTDIFVTMPTDVSNCGATNVLAHGRVANGIAEHIQDIAGARARKTVRTSDSRFHIARLRIMIPPHDYPWQTRPDASSA